MDDLKSLLEKIGSVADFAGIDVVDANTLGLCKSAPLHVAAVWGDCEAITLLVEAGAFIDQRGEDGFTPLMEAVAQGHKDAVDLLISLGAAPLRNDDGQLPSDYARVGGNEELSQLLARRGY
ncbi:ankyrin repeat domain-containing protein [Pseudoxanthomonas composti]|uniref:Ankyrin repeat domain-containing protein n=1 Tax=Pseudoxanthomonas composti TaxID=2137479 RepID=A0A4Q1JX93_9GAMM|nr:ankyrin repeat domain-containing protein [Pseudoxanthomonas composti]RXR06400.1 ankyrin repeat domain-containing protein [Pseudoxanthomonas composti]